MTTSIPDRADHVRIIWPDYRPTPLVDLPLLAEICGVGRIWAKLENERPLGNFKSLGGMYAGLWALAEAAGATGIDALLASPRAALPRLICASDGNHGLAVAAAAQRAGAPATIYLHENVPPLRSARIAALGAEIAWIAGSYDDAVDAAVAAAAQDRGSILIADTTDRYDDPRVARVMEGYSVIAGEIRDRLAADDRGAPTHMFVQAGVGGLAAAMASGLAPFMRAPRSTVVVEPETAPCVTRALARGRPEPGPESLDTAAEMLSCGIASAPALATLAYHGAASVLVSEAMLDQAPSTLARAGGPATTPSGAAGLAGLIHACADPALRNRLALGGEAAVLLIVTEGL